MYAFLMIRQPLSMNAKYKKTYQDEIKGIFRKQFPDVALVEDELYAAIYYFHKALGSQDADNITKPILDALKGAAYEDDKLIKLRQSAIIDVRSGAMGVIDLSRMPAELIKDFIENIDREDHSVYVEIGRLDYRQIQFSYENLYEA
jgi:Endodeoxyribonuclease RusA